MDYPSKSSVELALTRLAEEIGDNTVHPFRVDLLKIHGGQPPLYTVVVLSPKQMLVCDKLGTVIGRSFRKLCASESRKLGCIDALPRVQV
jgi:hypothetical protein